MFYLFYKGEFLKSMEVMGYLDYKKLEHRTYVYRSASAEWFRIQHINLTVRHKPISTNTVPKKLRMMVLVLT